VPSLPNPGTPVSHGNESAQCKKGIGQGRLPEGFSHACFENLPGCVVPTFLSFDDLRNRGWAEVKAAAEISRLLLKSFWAGSTTTDRDKRIFMLCIFR
jgi:hypothetical protein